jgi:hypothetical protein
MAGGGAESAHVLNRPSADGADEDKKVSRIVDRVRGEPGYRTLLAKISGPLNMRLSIDKPKTNAAYKIVAQPVMIPHWAVITPCLSLVLSKRRTARRAKWIA